MKHEKSSFAGAGAALLAVLGSVSCCGAPIAAGILASAGIGASQLQFLKSFQPYLIAIAVISLAIGFYRLYFKKNNSCCDAGNGNGNPKTSSKLFLWLVTIFTAIMLTLTYNINSSTTTTPESKTVPSCSGGSCGSVSQTISKETNGSCCSKQTAVSSQKTKDFIPLSNTVEKSCCPVDAALRTAYFSMEGMKTPCCVAPLKEALQKESGIKFYSVSFDRKQVGVKYDQKEISLDQIEKALDKTGYEATLSVKR